MILYSLRNEYLPSTATSSVAKQLYVYFKDKFSLLFACSLHVFLQVLWVSISCQKHVSRCETGVNECVNRALQWTGIPPGVNSASSCT